MGGDGDTCIFFPSISPSKPTKTAVLVYREPLVSRYGPESPFQPVLHYADDSSMRRVLTQASERMHGRVSASPSVLVSESVADDEVYLYTAHVLRQGQDG